MGGVHFESLPWDLSSLSSVPPSEFRGSTLNRSRPFPPTNFSSNRPHFSRG